MKRELLLGLSLLLIMPKTCAYEIFYPTEKKNVTTADYALFVGKTNGYESLKINGNNIFIAPNGAFAHSVKLKKGENRIVIKTNFGMHFYTFYKTIPVNQELTIDEFEPTKAIVKCNNIPLRSTPVDAGLNRIAHLFEGTNIIVNGTKGNFYRVLLTKDKVAWIDKKDVELSEYLDKEPAHFLNMDSERFKNATVQTISFSDTLPYTIEDTKKEIIFRVYNPEISQDSVYNLNIPKPKKYSYSVAEDCGKYTVKVRELPNDIKDITVVIDAGHGGTEKGAIGCLGDEEKNINLKIAQKVYDYLKQKGINVIMTRECDCNLSLDDRVNIAKNNDADIFVSIHLNSIGGNVEMHPRTTRGTSVYYFNENSKDLAEELSKSVTSEAGTKNEGIKTASFAVIRPTDYAAVLIETAYMTNPLDSCLYRNDKFLNKAAIGIAKGIIKYINN